MKQTTQKKIELVTNRTKTALQGTKLLKQQLF